jgi:hypothetical protein
VRELLRTGDIVRLSFLEALLADAGIDSIVLDRNTGSVFLGAVEPRLMVADEDFSRARWLVANQGDPADE